MHEPDIAPLARRLAEENNVDWRRLAGSGADGRVVERDVLGYLARVMAGDEAVDPTPEPVPDGMLAWPEDDVTAYRARANEPPAMSPPTLDDELFLFDDPLPGPDEPTDGVLADDPSPWPATAAASAYGGAAVTDDDAVLLVGDDDGFGLAAPTAKSPDRFDDGLRFDELPDLTEPDLAEPDLAGSDPIALDLAGPDPTALDLARPDPTALDPTALDPTDAAAPRVDGRMAFADVDLVLPELFAPVRADDDEGARRAGPELLFEDEHALAVVTGEAVGGNGELALEEPQHGELGPLPGEVAYLRDGGDDDADLAVAADLDDTTPTRAADPLREGGTDAMPLVAPAPPAVAVPASTGAQGFAFVRHGQVWRRRFDDRPLRTAVSEVAAEFEVGPGAVAALLIARAALRTGAVTGPIDAIRWRGGAFVRGTASADADLRAAIRAVERDEVGAGEAATLVVADLAEFDVDEAVLHLGVPVLTVGRASGGGSWLCLAGDEVDAAIVDALPRIAKLLATPVRLLL